MSSLGVALRQRNGKMSERQRRDLLMGMKQE
jgi:hypothetical protein